MKTIPLAKAICLLNSAERVLIIRNMEMATGVHVDENQPNFLWLETETGNWWFSVKLGEYFERVLIEMED